MSFDNSKYKIMAAYGLLLMAFGCIIDTPGEIIYGLYRIIIDPDILISDYIGVGGIGAAFVNSGILHLVSVYLLYKLKISITGASISSIWLMSGFGLFGKNVFNIWLIILGVYLYSRYQRDSFAKYVYIALLSTSLAPMITQIMFGIGRPLFISIPLSILMGVSIGFIFSPLSVHLMRVHQGFNLYNAGFTSGMVGTVFLSLFKSYGIPVQGRMIWTNGNNLVLGLFLFIMFISMIMTGYAIDKNSFLLWKNILKYPGRLVTDFVTVEGFAPSLMNMGINGLFALLYILLIKGDLNGPTIGGIFTIVGFSAFGKHIKNISPIILGVLIGSITKIWSINDPSVQLAALFGTTIAPIAGEFGWKYGAIAGYIHSSVTLSVVGMHGGLNLYNNGFAGGIVAAILVPIIEAFRRDDG